MLNLKNTEKKNKSFMYQNLQRSKCFNTNFSNSIFDYACFRGAHMKACAFDGCSFNRSEFIGSNLKESRFKGAHFENTVFEGTKLEGADFKGATFKNTYFVASGVDQALNLDLNNPEIRLFDEMPVLDLSPELQGAIEKLMNNKFVKNARVLDTKDKTMNTISVMILLEHFGEERLIEGIEKIETQIDRDFYTLSYLIKMMEK